MWNSGPWGNENADKEVENDDVENCEVDPSDWKGKEEPVPGRHQPRREAC